VLISAHAGYPRWVDSGVDFIAVDDSRLMRRFIADPRIKCIVTNRPDLALALSSARR
jgi:hypothetical protein